MGGVFLRKPRSRVEVVNDRAAEVANLFRIVREHPAELARQFDAAVDSRADFRRLAATGPGVLTDVQRAARFARLQAATFGGKPITAGAPSWGAAPGKRARFSAGRMRRLIAAAHRRLDGVMIEQLDWSDFVDRYDTPATLFYLDPPYWGHEDDYGPGLFTRADFARLADRLQLLRGQFVLSLNDLPEVRGLFSWAAVDTVATTYTLNAPAMRRAAELLICGGGADR